MMLFQQRPNPAYFPTMEAAVVNNANRMQLYLKLFATPKDVNMRGTMIVSMYDNIVSMLSSVQNGNHQQPEYIEADFALSTKNGWANHNATRPPSRASPWPVTNEEASEQSQTAAWAISPAWPSRPIGIARSMIDAISGLPAMAFCTMAVSV